MDWNTKLLYLFLLHFFICYEKREIKKIRGKQKMGPLTIGLQLKSHKCIAVLWGASHFKKGLAYGKFIYLMSHLLITQWKNCLTPVVLVPLIAIWWRRPNGTKACMYLFKKQSVSKLRYLQHNEIVESNKYYMFLI